MKEPRAQSIGDADKQADGLVERLTAERDEALTWISEATKMITNVIGGGSELFVRKGDVYRADMPYCCKLLRERAADKHETILREMRRRSEAEARLAAVERERDHLINANVAMIGQLAPSEAKVLALTAALVEARDFIIGLGQIGGDWPRDPYAVTAQADAALEQAAP